uniref:N-acetyltransferase domain-containing protein n=1 Tax=Angiostrongylus cantonensis TaxID=6313 RepID=A0A158PC35_ANGCA
MSADLRFSTATMKNAEEIEEFMHAEFGPREPITVSLNPSKSDLSDFFHDLSYSGYSNEKYSTIVHQRDRLIGICLCSVSTHDDSKAATSSQVQAANDNHLDAVCMTERNSAYAEKPHYQAPPTVFEFPPLCLAKIIGKLVIIRKGHGLGKELTKRAINVARSEGCDWVVTAATAAASQALFSRMGFETFYEIPFSNFCENRTVVFSNLFDGCSGGKLMAFRLNK